MYGKCRLAANARSANALPPSSRITAGKRARYTIFPEMIRYRGFVSGPDRARQRLHFGRHLFTSG